MNSSQKVVLRAIFLSVFLVGVAYTAISESTDTTFAYGGVANVSIPIVIPDRSPEQQVHEVFFTFALNGNPSSLAFELTIPPLVNQEGVYDLTYSASNGNWTWSDLVADSVSITVTPNGNNSYSVNLLRNPQTDPNWGPLGVGEWRLQIDAQGITTPLIYTTESGSLQTRLTTGNLETTNAATFGEDPHPNSVIVEPEVNADPVMAVPGIENTLCLDHILPNPAPPSIQISYEWEGNDAPVGTFNENPSPPVACKKEYLLNPDPLTYPVTADGESFTLIYTVTYPFPDYPLELQRSQPILVDHIPDVPEPPTGLRIDIGSSDSRSLFIDAVDGYDGDPLELTIDNDADLGFEATDDGYFRATLESTDTAQDSDFEAPDEVYSGITADTGTYLHFRYVPVTDAVFTKTLNISYEVDGTSVSAPITIQGEGQLGTPRQPQQISVVLDRSGSMSGSTACDEDGSPLRKIEALRQAAALFYRIFGSVAESDDTLSVVEYNQIPDLVVPSGPATVNATTAEGLLPAMNAGGSTSISLAVNEALNSISLPASPDDHERAVLLMTDGRHNTPWGESFEDHFNSLLIDSGSPQPGQCHMYSVGLGNDGNLNANLLTDLSEGALADLTENFLSGGYRHTCSDSKLAIYFAQILAENFRDLGVVSDDPGSVLPGQEAAQRMPVNSSARRALFYLTWQDPRVDLDFRLVAPDGTEIPIEQVEGNLSKLQVIDFPNRVDDRMVDHGGEWQMIVSVASAETGSSSNTTTVDFEAAVMVSDRVIQSEFSIVSGDNFSGEEVTLTATFREGGQPLQNADIVVLADVPLVGLGEFIFKNELSGDIDVQTGEEGDSAETLKLAALLEEMPEGLRRVVLEIPMHDDGRNPDTAAADGVFSLRLASDEGASQTEHNGVYTYTFRAEGVTELGEAVKRTTVRSQYLPSLVSDDNSTVTTNVVSPQVAIVSVTLRDRFGHFVDPIVGRTLRISPANPKIVEFRIEEAENNLDGTHSFLLQASSGTFSRFTDFDSIVDVDSFGLGAPPVDLTVKPFFWNFGIGMLSGYTFFPSNVSVAEALYLGAELVFQPFYLFEISAEGLVHWTDDSGGSDGKVIQYGLNAAYTVPWELPRADIQVVGGAGGMTFSGFSVEETNFSLQYGIRLLIRIDQERRFQGVAGFRDVVLTKSHGSSFVHLPQITAGFRFRL